MNNKKENKAGKYAFLVKHILLICLIIYSNCSFANRKENDIKALVENFCSKEFAGNLVGADVRDQLIRYTPKMLKKLASEACSWGNEYPYDMYLNCDPLFIVDAYEIRKIEKVDIKHAYAIINYHQLTKSKGRGEGPELNKEIRKLIKDIRNITVKLNLEHDGKRWWIIDPPYPKVSYDVMIKYYKGESDETYLYAIGKKGLPLRKSTPQEIARFKEVYNHEKSILDFLIRLKKQEIRK